MSEFDALVGVIKQNSKKPISPNRMPSGGNWDLTEDFVINSNDINFSVQGRGEPFSWGGFDAVLNIVDTNASGNNNIASFRNSDGRPLNIIAADPAGVDDDFFTIHTFDKIAFQIDNFTLLLLGNAGRVDFNIENGQYADFKIHHASGIAYEMDSSEAQHLFNDPPYPDSDTTMHIYESSDDCKVVIQSGNDDARLEMINVDGDIAELRCNKANDFSIRWNETRFFGATDTAIAFFGASLYSQASHIEDADGTLADITTKFNTLLGDLEGYGLLKSV